VILMKVLNNYKGEINGNVRLTYMDCKQLESALFYYMREEKNPDHLANANALRKQFKSILAAFDEDFEYGDYQGTF